MGKGGALRAGLNGRFNVGGRVSVFSFAETPAAFPVALAIDPLLLPPVDGEGGVTVCTIPHP